MATTKKGCPCAVRRKSTALDRSCYFFTIQYNIITTGITGITGNYDSIIYLCRIIRKNEKQCELTSGKNKSLFFPSIKTRSIRMRWKIDGSTIALYSRLPLMAFSRCSTNREGGSLSISLFERTAKDLNIFSICNVPYVLLLSSIALSPESDRIILELTTS